MTGFWKLTEQIWTHDGIREITEADKIKIQQQNQSFSMEGLRVLDIYLSGNPGETYVING